MFHPDQGEESGPVSVGGIAAERLRGIIERVERLEEERKALSGDIRDIFSEAKAAGFDVKVIRQIIRIRRQEPAEVEEQETLLDIYRRALGM
ncbi:MAG: GapR family DNA-binding domain-containing protein [Gluconacetobacter sp.]